MRDTDKLTQQPIPGGTVDPVSTTDPKTDPMPAPKSTSTPAKAAPAKSAPARPEPAKPEPAMAAPAKPEPMPAVDAEPIPVDRDGVDRDGPARGGPAPSTGTGRPATDEPLFAADVADRLRTRWRELQADFVDDPERAVRAADDVVDEVMKTITERRQRLTGEWQGHTDTEELRLALRGYRSFFDTLLPQ